MRPPEDEHSASEDQLLAQVIPLRRRTREPGDEAELSPITPHGQLPTGVFDPPQDPEPAEGYSVWEQPIAELIRRDEPQRVGRPSRSAMRIARAPRATLVGTLAAVSCVLVLIFSGLLAGPRVGAPRALSRDHASTRRTLATGTSAAPSHARSRRGRISPRPHSSTHNPARHTPSAVVATRSVHISGASVTLTAQRGSASNASQSSASAASGESGSAPPEPSAAAQMAAASAQTTATHE